MTQPPIICLMGPTATGKTALAIALASSFPCEIISVDATMVYRGMDIGTAKPDADGLKKVPHHLIDILDPKDSYSAGQFCRDAIREIQAISQRGKIPLLVGGTMLYFRVLTQGLTMLPPSDAALRAQLKARVLKEGLHCLYQELQTVDAIAAQRIQPEDSQRICRALEVYWQTGKPISTWQAENTKVFFPERFLKCALLPNNRVDLQTKIIERLEQMFKKGFLEEVTKLYQRGDLGLHLPAIRSVGYKEMWQYLAGEITKQEMIARIIIATRQLAKRQMTWLRAFKQVTPFDPADKNLLACLRSWLNDRLKSDKNH